MYPLALGRPFVVQQRVSGTGHCNGTRRGLATVTIQALLSVAAKLYGVNGNNLRVVLHDAGTGNAVTSTGVTQSGNVITVSLRRSTVALLATAGEVAAAINARSSLPVFARAVADTIMAATVSPAELTGGLDPVMTENLYDWDYAVNTHGGYFYFENVKDVVAIRDISMRFVVPTGTVAVTVSRVNVAPDGQIEAATKMVLYKNSALTSSDGNAGLANVTLLLHPRQVLLVETSTNVPGVVQVTAQKQTPFFSL